MTLRLLGTRQLRLPAALLAAALLATACGSGGGTSPFGPAASGSGDPTASTSAAAAPNPVASPMAPSTPIRYGKAAFVSPCQLFTPEVVAKDNQIGPEASIEQDYDPSSRTAEQMGAMGMNTAGGVEASCKYSLYDKSNTTLEFDVNQFSSPKAALAYWRYKQRLGSGADLRAVERMAARDAGTDAQKWAALGVDWTDFDRTILQMAREQAATDGGKPVKGLDSSILYVPSDGTPFGDRSFVGVHGNLVLTLVRNVYRKDRFLPHQPRATMGFVKDVFGAAYRSIDAGSLSQAPIPSWWKQAAGWAPFVEPCAILDDDVFSTGTGIDPAHPSGVIVSNEVKDTSVMRKPSVRIKRDDTPGTRAVYNECERHVAVGAPGTQSFTDAKVAGSLTQPDATLDVWYAAPGDSGPDMFSGVIDRYIWGTKHQGTTIAQLVRESYLKPITLDGADAAYLVNMKYSDGYQGRFVWALVGRTAFQLDMELSTEEKVPVADLVKAAGKAVTLLASTSPS